MDSQKEKRNEPVKLYQTRGRTKSESTNPIQKPKKNDVILLKEKATTEKNEYRRPQTRATSQKTKPNLISGADHMKGDGEPPGKTSTKTDIDIELKQSGVRNFGPVLAAETVRAKDDDESGKETKTHKKSNCSIRDIHPELNGDASADQLLGAATNRRPQTRATSQKLESNLITGANNLKGDGELPETQTKTHKRRVPNDNGVNSKPPKKKSRIEKVNGHIKQEKTANSPRSGAVPMLEISHVQNDGKSEKFTKTYRTRSWVNKDIINAEKKRSDGDCQKLLKEMKLTQTSGEHRCLHEGKVTDQDSIETNQVKDDADSSKKKPKIHQMPSLSKQKRDDLQLVANVYPQSITIGGEEFKLGEVVLAKMRGYPPWPAFVKEIYGSTNSNLNIIVEFFGDHTECKIAHNGICKYDKSLAIENITKRGYLKAIREADLAMEFQ